MPSVSVVVAVFNAERYLRECLESVISQTLQDIEIICVNDGSTDASGEILRGYAREDARIIIIEQENDGISSARNTGFDRSTGDYVLFLDADDFFEPTMLEDAYTRCVEDDAEMAVFRIRYFYSDKGTSIDAEWSLRMDLLPATTPFDPSEVVGSRFLFCTPAVWNKMLKRSFLIDARLRFSSDLTRAEDVPFIYLALMVAKRITVVDKPLVNYRTGVSGSLQATIHEAPLEICKALAMAKRDGEAAGVFGEVERDFVNAALHECLFTLDTLKTVEAFRTLYEALKSRYFEELGIDGRSEDHFYADAHYEQYLRVTELPVEEYLFTEARSYRQQRDDARSQSAQVCSQRDEAHDRLKSLSARLDELTAMLADTSARLVGAERENEGLSKMLDQAVAKLEAQSAKLADAHKENRRLEDLVGKTRGKLDAIEQSRWHRSGQRLRSVRKGIRRILPKPRKAE